MSRAILLAVAALTAIGVSPPSHAATLYEAAFPSVEDPSGCALPYYGDAVVLACSTTPRLTWSLPMTKSGKTRTVKVTASTQYFSTSLTCGVWPVGPAGILDYPTSITFTAAGQTLSATVRADAVAAFVTCDVPVGDGVAMLSWAQ